MYIIWGRTCRTRHQPLTRFESWPYVIVKMWLNLLKVKLHILLHRRHQTKPHLFPPPSHRPLALSVGICTYLAEVRTLESCVHRRPKCLRQLRVGRPRKVGRIREVDENGEPERRTHFFQTGTTAQISFQLCVLLGLYLGGLHTYYVWYGQFQDWLNWFSTHGQNMYLLNPSEFQFNSALTTKCLLSWLTSPMGVSPFQC